jgi:hypothetical protein
VQPTTIVDAHIEGAPVAYETMGDLWMPGWAGDGRLFLTWGDGTGAAAGFPMGYPAYQSSASYDPGGCSGYFPCDLWCAVHDCTSGPVARAPLTDAGILQTTGTLPNLASLDNVAIDIPEEQPFIIQDVGGPIDVTGVNDKPSSLLVIGNRLYLAGHSPAGEPVRGYIAYSDDWGATWTTVPNSPWGNNSNFRVLMLINMGQAYGLNTDGYVYGLGVGTEASWTKATVYLARVPVSGIANYSAYEYLSGIDSAGQPTWDPNQANATPVKDLHTTGQASAMFHAGVGSYLMLTTDSGDPAGPQAAGALYQAPQPWGPWARVATLCFLPECSGGNSSSPWTDGKYIAGLIPKDAGSDFVYFTIAGGDNHYQLQIGKLVFDLSP